MLPRTVDNNGRQFAAVYREHCDGIEYEYEQHGSRIVALQAVDVADVSGRPEEEEPPDSVGKELCEEDAPSLWEGEELDERNGFLVLYLLFGRFLILLDISQLSLVHAFTFLWLLVDEHPESEPDEAKRADDDESHLPSIIPGNQGNTNGCDECSDSTSAIEDAGGESSVLLWEVLRRYLDGSREVAAFAKTKHDATYDKEPNADRRNDCRACAYSIEEVFLTFKAEPLCGCHAAEGMHTGSQRPDADGPKVAFLGTNPVHKATAEEVADSINNGENGGNATIVGIRPMEFGGDKVFPCEGKDLSVHVVDSGCEEKHPADEPTIIGHLA